MTEVAEDSIAEHAGVNAGDYIVGFNRTKIHNLSDIKISLLYAKEGAKYKLKVKRGDQVLNLSTSF